MPSVFDRPCEKCGEAFLKVDAPFVYTRLAGLDPMRDRVVLHGICSYHCSCGVSPVIPHLTGLHHAIVENVINESSMEESEKKFLMKSLHAAGMKPDDLWHAIGSDYHWLGPSTC